jgi:hypothetical protein
LPGTEEEQQYESADVKQKALLQFRSHEAEHEPEQR